MQERGNDCINIDLEVSQNHGNSNWVNDIGFTRLTLLVTVCLVCKNKCLTEQLVILLDIILIEIGRSGILIVEL